MFNSDRSLGYSEWRGLLEQNNYQIDNVSLFASGVPDDAKVVVSLGPQKDFLPEELAALAKYLGHGGHYVAIIDPYGSPTLVEFLKKYYLDFIPQVVVDPAYRLTAGEILTTQIPLRSEDKSDEPLDDCAGGVFAGARRDGDRGGWRDGAGRFEDRGRGQVPVVVA